MRTATIERKTKETSIKGTLNLDGTGRSGVGTGVPFLDHMLDLFVKHSLIDLKIEASGDTRVDAHHTVEDAGIVLGLLTADALGEKKGIHRFGCAAVPMDEALSRVTLDLSGRPYFVFEAVATADKVGDMDSEVIKEFLQAFSFNGKFNLHVKNYYGDNTHHIFESIFKALALAFREAVTPDSRIKGVPSTKDVL